MTLWPMSDVLRIALIALAAVALYRMVVPRIPGAGPVANLV